MSNRAVVLTLTGLITSFNSIARAGTVARIKSGDFSELTSLIPLAIFFVAAVFVYLCNRPRKVVEYSRSRRRTASKTR